MNSADAAAGLYSDLIGGQRKLKLGAHRHEQSACLKVESLKRSIGHSDRKRERERERERGGGGTERTHMNVSTHIHMHI